MIDPSFIGKTFGPVKYEVGLEKIKEYAIATGDENPFYIDEEAAKKGPFQEIVAPPLFAVVYMRGVLKKTLYNPELGLDLAMLLHGEQEFQFHELVRPGAVVQSVGKVIDVRQKGSLDMLTLEIQSTVDERPVTTGKYTFVIRGES